MVVALCSPRLCTSARTRRAGSWTVCGATGPGETNPPSEPGPAKLVCGRQLATGWKEHGVQRLPRVRSQVVRDPWKDFGSWGRRPYFRWWHSARQPLELIAQRKPGQGLRQVADNLLDSNVVGTFRRRLAQTRIACDWRSCGWRWWAFQRGLES